MTIRLMETFEIYEKIEYKRDDRWFNTEHNPIEDIGQFLGIFPNVRCIGRMSQGFST